MQAHTMLPYEHLAISLAFEETASAVLLREEQHRECAEKQRLQDSR
jgi:hypothetical protein